MRQMLPSVLSTAAYGMANTERKHKRWCLTAHGVQLQDLGGHLEVGHQILDARAVGAVGLGVDHHLGGGNGGLDGVDLRDARFIDA